MTLNSNRVPLESQTGCRDFETTTKPASTGGGGGQFFKDWKIHETWLSQLVIISSIYFKAIQISLSALHVYTGTKGLIWDQPCTFTHGPKAWYGDQKCTFTQGQRWYGASHSHLHRAQRLDKGTSNAHLHRDQWLDMGTSYTRLHRDKVLTWGPVLYIYTGTKGLIWVQPCTFAQGPKPWYWYQLCTFIQGQRLDMGTRNAFLHRDQRLSDPGPYLTLPGLTVILKGLRLNHVTFPAHHSMRDTFFREEKETPLNTKYMKDSLWDTVITQALNTWDWHRHSLSPLGLPSLIKWNSIGQLQQWIILA